MIGRSAALPKSPRRGLCVVAWNIGHPLSLVASVNQAQRLKFEVRNRGKAEPQGDSPSVTTKMAKFANHEVEECYRDGSEKSARRNPRRSATRTDRDPPAGPRHRGRPVDGGLRATPSRKHPGVSRFTERGGRRSRGKRIDRRSAG